MKLNGIIALGFLLILSACGGKKYDSYPVPPRPTPPPVSPYTPPRYQPLPPPSRPQQTWPTLPQTSRSPKPKRPVPSPAPQTPSVPAPEVEAAPIPEVVSPEPASTPEAEAPTPLPQPAVPVAAAPAPAPAANACFSLSELHNRLGDKSAGFSSLAGLSSAFDPEPSSEELNQYLEAALSASFYSGPGQYAGSAIGTNITQTDNTLTIFIETPGKARAGLALAGSIKECSNENRMIVEFRILAAKPNKVSGRPAAGSFMSDMMSVGKFRSELLLTTPSAGGTGFLKMTMNGETEAPAESRPIQTTRIVVWRTESSESVLKSELQTQIHNN